MILYLSGLGHFKKLHSFIQENCPDVGVLCTFADPKEFYRLVEAGFKNIMVDSGAFSVSTKGLKIDIEQYIEFLLKNKSKITYSISLDVIDNAEKSYENYLYMKRFIPNIIPVYHLGEDIKWLDLYCNQTDFIGVGGIVGVTNWKINGMFLKRVTSRYPNHKIHIFGLNSYRALRMIDAYSCDASSWLIGQKFTELNSENGRIKLRQEKEDSKIWRCLQEEWGVSYSDFLENKHDYNQLNKFNIKFLYELISNHQKIDVSEQEELF